MVGLIVLHTLLSLLISNSIKFFQIKVLSMIRPMNFVKVILRTVSRLAWL